eukprot:1534193-Pleurochrysis_carterae.AAC.2
MRRRPHRRTDQTTHRQRTSQKIVWARSPGTDGGTRLPEATTAHPVTTYVGLRYEADFITDKALRKISGLHNTEEYTARADQLTSRATGLFSESVAWVEIDDDGRKSVVQVGVLKC